MADVGVNLNGKDNLSKTIKEAQKSVDDLKKSTTELGKAEKDFDRITNSGKSLKAQLNQLKTLMAEMEFKGLAGTDEFTKIAQYAGQVKDALSDASAAVNKFSSDTLNLDAAIQAVQGVAAAASIATGVMGLFGAENEKVQQAILKVQSALAILNGVQAIANTLNKDSALMQKIKQIRLAATTASTTTNTVATAANTVATVANTAAQKSWNVAKAIGKAMFGDFTGLVLLGVTAMTLYSTSTQAATTEEQKRNKVLEESQNLQKERTESEERMSTAVANGAANQIAAYLKLQAKWKECGNDVKKQEKFMTDYKTEISNTGFALNSLSDAENFFVKNTDAVLAAITARAEAQANYELMVEKLKKGIELANEQSIRSGKYFQAATTQNLTEEEKKALDKRFGTNKWREEKATFSSLGTSHNGLGGASRQALDYVNELRQDAARNTQKAWKSQVESNMWDDVNVYLKGMQEANARADKIIKENNLHSGGGGNPSPNSGGGGGSTHTPKVAPPPNEEEKAKKDSIEWMEKEVQELQKNLRWGLIDEDKIQTAKNRISELQKEISQKKIELGFEGPKAVEGSLTELKEKLSTLQKQLSDGLIPQNKIETTKEEIRTLQEEIDRKEMELKIKPIAGSVEELQEEIKQIEKQLSKQNLDVPARLKLNQKKDELQRQVDELTNGKLTVKALVKPTYINEGSRDDKRKSYENAQERITQLENDYKHKIISLKKLKEEARKVNDELKKLEVKPIKINFETNFDQFIEKIKKNFDAVDSLTNLGNSILSLTQKIKDNATAWEIIVSSIQVAESALSGILGVTQFLNNLSKLTSSFKIAEAGATQAATTATTEKAIADTAAVAPAEAATVALKAQEAAYMDMAAAAIYAAHAAIPFAGVGIASGLVAAMMAAMTAQHAASLALAAFAEGGIVGGSSPIGDKMLVRVNSGEMILNGKQQRRLFDILNGGGAIANNTPNQTITWRIKGADLYGALNNYGKIKSKTGGL